FEQSEIPVLESRLVDQISNALGVERPGCRGRKNGCAVRILGCEPLTSRAECADDLGIAIHYPILTVDAASEIGVESHACEVSGLRDAASYTGLELTDSAELPSTQQFAAQLRCVAEERQSVDVVDHENMT